MRPVVRWSLRAAALVGVLVVLVGVPVVVVWQIGLAAPGSSGWAGWSGRRLGDGAVIQVGVALFALLWSWFAISAAAECWHLLRCRREARPLAPRSPKDGPTQAVRSLVRFIAVGSFAAGTALATLAVSPSTSRAAAPTTHTVEEGDSYWGIAQQHLRVVLGREPAPQEVVVLTERLMQRNAPRLGHLDPALILPGETLLLAHERVEPDVVSRPVPAETAPAREPAAVPTVASLPTSESAIGPATGPTTGLTTGPTTMPTTGPTAGPAADPAEEAPVTAAVASESRGVRGLAAAVLLAVGATAALDARRRRRLRSAGKGARPAAPSLAQARAEMLLRSAARVAQVDRVDAALRSAAPQLAAAGAAPLLVLHRAGDDLRLVLKGSAVPEAGPWRLEADGTWLLPPSVPTERLVRGGAVESNPCPALAHLGTTLDGVEVFADLEAVGVLSVQSPVAPEVLSAVAATLSLSPFMSGGTVVTAELPVVVPAAAGGFDGVLPSLTAALAELPTVRADRATFADRAEGVDSWEPTVVVASAADDDPALVWLRPLTDVGRGAVVVVDAPVDDAGAVLRCEGDVHVLEPFGLQLQPVGIDAAALRDMDALLRAEEFVEQALADPLLEDASPGALEPEWALLVRTFGTVDVCAGDGTPVRFERSKSLELVAWLSHHRRRPTRSAARAALWETEVRDATFANVVSEARRSMARLVPRPDGSEWIERSVGDELPLHRLVVSDAEVLEARLAASRGLSAAEAVTLLRPALELVEGMPFAGTSWLWADAEGISSAMVVLATGAAIELAERYLELGDMDGVFWATGRGLTVLNGHEECIALRMRAHAERGDLAGVRAEWERYERALAADPWSAGDPAPKLVQLRSQLLRPTARAVG